MLGMNRKVSATVNYIPIKVTIAKTGLKCFATF